MKGIEPVLYVDIQARPPKCFCPVCLAECYGPEAECPRCERRKG